MSNQADNEGAEMTFGEHLDELRKILIRVALIFSVLFIVFFILKGIVLDIVFAPIRPEFPTNRLFTWLAAVLNSETLNIHPENVELFNNKMAGQFMLHIKSSIVGAFVVAFPYLIWELWLFVKPALPPYQRKQSIRYVVETPVWFIIGLPVRLLRDIALGHQLLGQLHRKRPDKQHHRRGLVHEHRARSVVRGSHSVPAAVAHQDCSPRWA